MIGYHIDNNIVADSNGNVIHNPSGINILDIFLNENRKDVNIFYHLDANVASLLHIIGITKPEAQKLKENGKVYITPYTIKYYQDKMLCIDWGFGVKHPYVNIYNAKQYADSTDIMLKQKYTEQEAIDCAKKAKMIGLKILDAFYQLELPTYKLTSPVNVYLTGHHLDLPTSLDIPEDIDKFAFQCVKGNWLEAFSCGYWEEAYDYDLNGAYASELAWLMDLRKGKWIRDNKVPNTAVYGFAKGTITTWVNFHPFLTKGRNNLSYTPVGTWEDYLTLQEIKFLYRNKLGEFKIDEGYWWLNNKEPEYPLQDIVFELYKHRQETDNQVLVEVIKRILSGLWGKFTEVRHGTLGQYTNNVYGAIVETNARLRVAQECIDNGIVPLCVAIDGFISDKKLPRTNTGDKLGEWRLSNKGKCIIVNSSIVGFENKAGKEEFSVTFDWIYNQIKDKPGEDSYYMSKYSPITFTMATDEESKNISFEDMGKVVENVRSVYIDVDSKRLWQKRPLTGGGLLEMKVSSSPLDINVVRGNLL